MGVIAPYLAFVVIGSDPGSESTCPYLVTTGYISDIDKGGSYPTNPSTMVFVQYVSVNTGDAWENVCAFQDTIHPSFSTFTHESIVPGCYDAATTSGSDDFSARFNTLVNSCV